MLCHQKNNEIVIEVFHKLKKIYPMLDYFKTVEPKNHCDVIAQCDEIQKMLTEVAQKELQLFGGSGGKT
ncbi:MAG: hypothetical protein B6242_12295 [Anaerolineaceae bacterium 4572_78]|nr:MAG: hypothetical protein B6242_12295 [Anaerolineaceae bacterium 4572_78]